MSCNPGLVPTPSYVSPIEQMYPKTRKLPTSEVESWKNAKLRSVFLGKFFAYTRGNMGSNNQFVEGCIETKQLLNIGTYAYFFGMTCV